MSWLSPLKAPGSHRYLDLKELLHFFFEKKKTQLNTAKLSNLSFYITGYLAQRTQSIQIISSLDAANEYYSSSPTQPLYTKLQLRSIEYTMRHQYRNH